MGSMDLISFKHAELETNNIYFEIHPDFGGTTLPSFAALKAS